MGISLDPISKVDEDTPSEEGLSGGGMFNLQLQLLLKPFGLFQTFIFEHCNQVVEPKELETEEEKEEMKEKKEGIKGMKVAEEENKKEEQAAQEEGREENKKASTIEEVEDPIDQVLKAIRDYIEESFKGAESPSSVFISFDDDTDCNELSLFFNFCLLV
ncbi:hypothetical protein JCGZ_03082 [Jatropha curcas]|uniref:Uncharacterized protein n=1 Tax=Jatropha curcas TaxID=180498 RepID=A0A067LD48_JATCU|nr:hypothetical protein JCGZ_03082 [Jatropha curcas]